MLHRNLTRVLDADMIPIYTGLELGEQPPAGIDSQPGTLDVLLIHGLVLMAIAAHLGYVISCPIVSDLKDLLSPTLYTQLPRASVLVSKARILPQPLIYRCPIWHVVVSADSTQALALRQS